MDGPATSSRFAHGSNASKSGAYRDKDEAVTEDSPSNYPPPASASHDPRVTTGRADAPIKDLPDEDSDDHKAGEVRDTARQD